MISVRLSVLPVSGSSSVLLPYNVAPTPAYTPIGRREQTGLSDLLWYLLAGV